MLDSNRSLDALDSIDEGIFALDHQGRFSYVNRAARQLLPLCPEEAVGPIKDALSQVQMLYVKETQAAPSAEGAPSAEEEAKQRAEARAKIWTPPGS